MEAGDGAQVAARLEGVGQLLHHQLALAHGGEVEVGVTGALLGGAGRVGAADDDLAAGDLFPGDAGDLTGDGDGDGVEADADQAGGEGADLVSEGSAVRLGVAHVEDGDVVAALAQTGGDVGQAQGRGLVGGEDRRRTIRVGKVGRVDQEDAHGGMIAGGWGDRRATPLPASPLTRGPSP